MSGNSELETRARARLNTTLRGKYRLDRVLGVGGMAVVYAATHRNQKQFAIKMLHAELSIRDDVRQRFLREGYAANSVKHPGALAVLDEDQAEDGAAFLVMELLDGASLDDLWERWDHRVPLEQVLAIGAQLLDVLEAAHAKGIVHRDIKPANLFVTREGVLKVLDFGIARVRDVAASSANATGTGLLLGTPAFMSPEQAFAKSSEIDAQTDVWAVGATLFTLASGRMVHEGETASEIVINTATKPARSLSMVAPDLPPRAISVIDRALGFAKNERWASAAAMRKAIADTHLALLGRAIAQDALLPLLARAKAEPVLLAGTIDTPSEEDRPVPTPVDAPLVRTEPMRGPGELGQRPSGPNLPAPRTPNSASDEQGLESQSPRPVGSTTAQPVASAARPHPNTIARRRASMVLGAFVSAGVLAGGLAAVLALRYRGAAPAEVTSATATAARAEMPRASAAPAPTQSSTVPTLSIDDLPSATPAVTQPPPAPRAAPMLAPQPSPARPAASTSAVKPQVSCSPPFFIDNQGRKVFKPECVN